MDNDTTKSDLGRWYLSTNNSLTWTVVSLVFSYLDIIDVLRCSIVCKTWRNIVNDLKWYDVTVRGRKVHLDKMIEFLKHRKTTRLKLINCYFPGNHNNSYEMESIPSLKILEMTGWSFKLLESFVKSNPQLTTIRAHIIRGASDLKINLNFIAKLSQLTELKLYCNRELENFPEFFSDLKSLRHLCLLGVKHIQLNNIQPDKMPSNCTLRYLALGDCTLLPHQFTNVFLLFMSLERLRLEKCSIWDAYAVLKSLSQLKSLVCLELVEFNITEDFERGLKLCTNLRELIIIPKLHRFDMPNYNTRTINGVLSLKDTLKVFTWGFCEKYATYFKKYLEVDDCVPVLDASGLAKLMSFDDLERTLAESMVHTKVTVKKLGDSDEIW